MKLYPKAIPAIAKEVIHTLMSDGDIVVDTVRIGDAEQDMAAVLRGYLDAEERVNQKTREVLSTTGQDHSQFSRVKRSAAESLGFKLGDEGIEYMIAQMLEFLFYSRNVEEVFSDDAPMRRKLMGIFRRHLEVDADIDREARGRLKHLAEGTQAWDIEYQKVVEALRRNRGL